MTEHSPGPWTYDGPPSNIHVVQADRPHMRVCFMTSNGPTVANARLIAAAPDLLDACADAWCALADTGDAQLREVADKCRAAIGRAMDPPPSALRSEK